MWTRNKDFEQLARSASWKLGSYPLRFQQIAGALLWRLRCCVRGREADIPISSAFPADAADGRFIGGIFMTRNYQNVMDRTIIIQGNLHELVRGEEQRLVNELQPVVRKQSVTLDMRHIERIDAAGIAVLISLYGEAHMTGHEFAIVNASHRVAEILELVGLNRILISQDAQRAIPCPQGENCYEMPAA
jgi:anti-anti-sigma factor